MATWPNRLILTLALLILAHTGVHAQPAYVLDAALRTYDQARSLNLELRRTVASLYETAMSAENRMIQHVDLSSDQSEHILALHDRHLSIGSGVDSAARVLHGFYVESPEASRDAGALAIALGALNESNAAIFRAISSFRKGHALTVSELSMLMSIANLGEQMHRLAFMDVPPR